MNSSRAGHSVGGCQIVLATPPAGHRLLIGPGYKFPDEVTGQETYPRGTVAMGNQGPGTNGSEFFVVHSHANIPPNYTVLGQVVSGMDTFDRIVAAGIADPDLDGPPTSPVRIYQVKVGAQHG